MPGVNRGDSTLSQGFPGGRKRALKGRETSSNEIAGGADRNTMGGQCNISSTPNLCKVFVSSELQRKAVKTAQRCATAPRYSGRIIAGLVTEGYGRGV